MPASTPLLLGSCQLSQAQLLPFQSLLDEKIFKGQNGQKLPGFQFWGYSPVRRNVHHEIASPRPRVSPTALHFMDEEIGEAECCSSAHLVIKPHLPRLPCATLGHPLLIWHLKELESLSEAGTSVFSFYKEY